MLAPVSPSASRPTLLDSFADLLHTARLEALTVLRSLMRAGSDDATPAAILRERRLAATAILRVPCEPAKHAPAHRAPSDRRAVNPAPAEQRGTPRNEAETLSPSTSDAAERAAQSTPPIASGPPGPPFKQRRGATPIASLRRRSGAPDAHAGGSG